MSGGTFVEGERSVQGGSTMQAGTFYQNKTNAIDELSKENVVRHL